MKKWICLLLVICMALGVVGCVGFPTEPTEPVDTANTQAPADTDVVLTINKENGNEVVFGIGTELDPHFFSQNVGLTGISNGSQCVSKTGTVYKQIEPMFLANSGDFP